VQQVWSFASATMPFVAVALTAGGRDVHLYHGRASRGSVGIQAPLITFHSCFFIQKMMRGVEMTDPPWLGRAAAPLAPAQCDALALLGASLRCHAGPPPAAAAPAGVVLALAGCEGEDRADGIVGESVLYIANPAKIDPEVSSPVRVCGVRARLVGVSSFIRI
jgi:hypothetical protein